MLTRYFSTINEETGTFVNELKREKQFFLSETGDVRIVRLVLNEILIFNKNSNREVIIIEIIYIDRNV